MLQNAGIELKQKTLFLIIKKKVNNRIKYFDSTSDEVLKNFGPRDKIYMLTFNSTCLLLV